MTNLEKAYNMAEKAHMNQSYDGTYTYMYHIQMVVNVLEQMEYDEEIVIAGILHDVIEDSNVSYNDIKKQFGESVAEIVYAVTDELGRNRKERKKRTYPKIAANWKAVVVKVADRIANMSYSKQFSPDMFKMYQKEYSQFVDQLYNRKDLQCERIWNKLFLVNSK